MVQTTDTMLSDHVAERIKAALVLDTKTRIFHPGNLHTTANDIASFLMYKVGITFVKRCSRRWNVVLKVSIRM